MKSNESKYRRAMARVDKLRGFYNHFIVYVIVNVVISIFKVVRNIEQGETYAEAIFDLNTFIVWLFWGIGLAMHAFSVFGLPMILGKDWEQRKIDDFMKNDRTK